MRLKASGKNVPPFLDVDVGHLGLDQVCVALSMYFTGHTVPCSFSCLALCAPLSATFEATDPSLAADAPGP